MSAATIATALVGCGSSSARPTTSGTATTRTRPALTAADGTSVAVRDTGGGAADGLRVVRFGTDWRLADAQGRRHLLRGVNVNALVGYADPNEAVTAFDRRDLDEIAALGLDVIRLPVSWSRIMPAPGRLDRAYLRLIRKIVLLAGQRGIHVVPSLHSDRYAAGLGSGTEFDGAPAWAVLRDGQPCGTPSGAAYYTPCAAAAARHFYDGTAVAGRPLTSWYADALVALSRAARGGGAGYAGVDVLNEPQGPDGTTPQWIAERLVPLYRMLVARLRASGERRPIWLQPEGTRAVRVGGGATRRLLRDDQLVYAPHAYLHVYGRQPGPDTAVGLADQYAAFAREARTQHAALVVGEFPGAAGGVWDQLRRAQLAEQRRLGVGGIAWLWKQPAGGYGWGLVQPDGAPRPGTDAAAVMSGPRLLAARDGRTSVTARAGTVVVRSRARRGETVDVWLGSRWSAAGRLPERPRVVARSTRPGVRVDVVTRRAAGAAYAVAGAEARIGVPPGGARITLRYR